jgi:hypothetical protein
MLEGEWNSSKCLSIDYYYCIIFSHAHSLIAKILQQRTICFKFVVFVIFIV